ncbi:MAG: DUF1624 domain-containing protein [Firmicutes bacterium]|nr:DUF1624 domain-containing protein [Bacillota bacterium]
MENFPKNGNFENSLRDLVILMKKPKANKRNRVWEVDFLRSICILLMLWDHLMFNFAFLDENTVFGNFIYGHDLYVGNVFFESMHAFASFYWGWTVRVIVRNIVVFLFLFLSGISCALTKNNKERLIKLAAAAGIVTIVTYFVDLIMRGGGSLVSVGGVETGGTALFILTGILYMATISLAFFMMLQFAFKNLNKSKIPILRYIFPFICVILFALLLWGGISIRFWDYNRNTRILRPLTELNNLDFFAWAIVLSFLLVAFFLFRVYRKRLSRKMRGLLNKGFPNKLSKQNDGIYELIENLVYAVITFVGVILLLALLRYQPMGEVERRALWELFVGHGYFGADFYGVFPYVGYFFLGGAVGMLFYTNKQSKLKPLDGWWNKTFCFIGRNALMVYLVHQIILFVAVALGAMAVGYRFW